MAGFNERTIDGDLVILEFGGRSVSDVFSDADRLSVHRVLLHPDTDDFTVEADLVYRYVGELMEDGWVARPIWSTLKRT